MPDYQTLIDAPTWAFIQKTNASGLKLDDFTIGDIKLTPVTLDAKKQATQAS